MPAILATLLLATACGDGITDPPPGEATTLVIAPGALLFTAAGETQQLRAFAVDADGDSTEVAATFSSSDPSVVSVTAVGLATGGGALGSAQIVARSGELVSAPALALRATPAAGALLVADSQVVGTIEPLSTRAEYGPGWRYRIRLRNAQPSAGQIVLGTGSAPVAGRVVSITQEGDGVLATIELVEIADLFTELEIDEAIPLSNVAPVVPTSSRRGSTLAPGALHLGATDVEFEVGSFECAAKGEFGQEGFTLDAGELSLTHSLTLEVVLNAGDGLRRMAVVGNVQASQAFKPRITLTASGEIECHAILFTIPIPITGPLSYFIGGQIPLGAGFKLAGQLSFPNVGADIALAVQGELATGIDCTGGCHPIFELATSGTGSSFKPVLPAQFGTAARLKLDASAFARVEFAVGSALLQEFQYEILAVKLGLTQSFDLATREGQAADPAYASNFSIKPLVYGGTESEADSLGMWGIELPALEFEPDLDPLDKSPTGTITITPASVAAGTDASVGELATFTITISDPTYLGAYAVEGVEVRWQKTNGGVVTLEPGRPGCTDLNAAADQLTFTCQTYFLAEHAGAQTFYAYLKTRIFGIPVPVPLEINPDASATVTVTGGAISIDPSTATLSPGGIQEFTAVVAGEGANAVTWSATGGTIVATGNTVAYTAGTVPGTYAVTATSITSPTVSTSAAVTIAAPAGGRAVLTSIGGFAQTYLQFPDGNYDEKQDDYSETSDFLTSRSIGTQSSHTWTPSNPEWAPGTISASASSSASYQLTQSGQSLLTITASGSANATSTTQAEESSRYGGKAYVHSADLWFYFEVEGTVTVTLTGQVSSSGGEELPRAFVELDRLAVGPVFLTEGGAISTTLTLGPGRYSLRGDVYAEAHSRVVERPTSTASGSFNVTLTISP